MAAPRRATPVAILLLVATLACVAVTVALFGRAYPLLDARGRIDRADAPAAWPTLLRIARDQSRPRETRSQAVFWLGQAAGDVATRELKKLAVEDTIDREIKQQVVFALSRRPTAEAVPALIDVARTHRDPEVRRTALFWLAKQDDPRALEYIEKLVMLSLIHI